MRRIVFIALLLAALPALATVQVQSCTAGTETPAALVAPLKTTYAYVSNSSNGAKPYCKLLSGMSPTAFVAASTDGKPLAWIRISAALAPPVVPVGPPMVILTWPAVTKDTAGALLKNVSYTVYRGASATTLVKLGSTTDVQYVDTTVKAGAAYFYGVTAVVESDMSGVGSAAFAATASVVAK